MNAGSLPARGWRSVLAAALLACAGSAAAQTAPADAAAPSGDTRKAQTLAFSEVPAHVATDAPFRLSAQATSGLPVTFEVIDGPATIDGRTLKLSGTPGLVIVRATQGGNDLYRPAQPQEQAFAVTPKPVAPAFIASPVPARVALGEPVILEARATGEPAPAYQWRRDGRPIEGAQGRTYTIPTAALSDAGLYDVVATNKVGTARSATVQVTVTKRAQTISFFPPATAVVNQPVNLSAMASSGLPVHFEVVSGTATLTGATIIPNGAMITVTATQEGDGTYEAALPVTQTILVQPGPQGQGQHF